MQPPNRLGAVLGYCADAYRHAFPSAKAEKRNIGYGILRSISESARYNEPENVTTDQALRLAAVSAWVYSGIKTIADRVSASDARPEMKLRVGIELRDQPNHEFSRLLDQPNSLMTWEFMCRYTAWWAFLLGNAYIFIATPEIGVGMPEELWPLPADAIAPDPKSMRISKLTGKPCIDYIYTLDGKQMVLPGENVIHIRFPNPFDYWYGMAPLSAMISPVRLDRYQAGYLQGFFGRDNAVPTAIISVPQETNEIDFETIKEQIREQFGEGRRSAITRAGDMSVQVITQTIQQMELVNGRKFNREEINHVLGIPEGLLSGGLSGDSRLATEITFARITVQPYLDLMAAELTANLAPYYGPDYVCKAPSVIPQDRALALQEYEKYSPDRSINENRQVLHLPPLDLPGIVEIINAIRVKAGLEEIDTPLDSILIDLMLFVPVRLIPIVSSNTFANASQTGLRPGQTNAGGEMVEDPLQRMIDAAAAGVTGPVLGKPAIDNNSGSIKPPAQQNIEKPAKPASMIGAPGGAREVQINAGKAYIVEAARIGQREELLRWKRVAMKLARDGGNPASKSFETGVLPGALQGRLIEQIDGADETKCGIVFDTVIATLQEIEL
jgi:HK97 family phage portal protein